MFIDLSKLRNFVVGLSKSGIIFLYGCIGGVVAKFVTPLIPMPNF